MTADTIEIHGERIRLEGIDAPESQQTFTDRVTGGGAEVRCGQQSALWLADLIAEKPVSCNESSRDRYKRVLAHCSVAGQDIGAAMVEPAGHSPLSGTAANMRRRGGEGTDAKAGIWLGYFVAPGTGARGALTRRHHCDPRRLPIPPRADNDNRPARSLRPAGKRARLRGTARLCLRHRDQPRAVALPAIVMLKIRAAAHSAARHC